MSPATRKKFSILSAPQFLFETHANKTPAESKANPSSRQRFHFAGAINEAENFMQMMELVKEMDLHVFWFRRMFHI